MSVSNQLRPKGLPGRRWSGALYRPVHYLLGELGHIGFLARWRRQGRVPLELGARLRPAQFAFDHAEHWIGYADDLLTRNLDRRVLVGHPYRLDEATREALAAACTQFGLTWQATPPKNAGGTGITSWYSDSTWLVIVQPLAYLVVPEPRECGLKGARSERRPMIEGETLDTMVEKPSARARKARRAGRAPQISFTEAITDTAGSLERLAKWRLLQEKRRRIEELLAATDVDRELEEADKRLKELSGE